VNIRVDRIDVNKLRQVGSIRPLYIYIDYVYVDYGVATVSRIDKIIGLFCRI